VVYLVIMFLVGAVGLGSLAVQQRRERAHLGSVEGFRNSLAKIAPEARPGPFRKASAPRRPGMVPGRRVPMTAAQRESARRRVEARRRAQGNGRPRPRSGAVRRVS
jgi:hypothetical protein